MRALASLLTAGLLAGTALAAELPRAAGGKPATADFVRAWGVAAEGFHQRFARHGDLGVQQVAGSAPANLLWPGESATLTVQLVNHGRAPLAVAGRWLLVAYRLTTRGEDVFDLGLERDGEQELGALAATIPAQGFTDCTLAVDPPPRFGGYALLLEPAGGPRLFVAGLARIARPALEPGDRFHQVAMDLDLPEAITRLRTPANRLGIGYVPGDHPDAAADWERRSAHLRRIHATGFPVCIEFGAGPDRGPHHPLGRLRPHLDDQGVMRATKSDYAWLPAYDRDFKATVKRYALAFGWPRGPVNAMKLWNEPWNGISISGWGADDLRYREIYTALCEAVEEARAEGGVQILVGGCDSSSNTNDKLFPDGSLGFLPRLDFLSIHYQGLQPGGLVRSWRDRQGPEGRVRIWDTESWVANSGDRVPGVFAGMLAAGTDRLVGIQSHAVVATPSRIEVRLAGGGRERREVIHAWPVAAALAAFQDAVGQRRFRALLWHGLPWVFAFDGRERAGAPDPDDATLVVCGDIGAFFGADQAALRTCRGLAEHARKDALRARRDALPAGDPARAALERELARSEVLSGAAMTLAAGRWRLLDGDGNPVEARDGRLRIPLDGSGWYLRPDGSPGSGEALLAAVRAARIDGYAPCAVTVRDPLEPLERRPAIRVALRNVLNRAVAVRLRASAPGLVLEAPERVEVAAHSEAEVAVRIAGGTPAASNAYALRLELDAGDDGRATHEETVHVNRIARRAITVDGDLADWQGALPQTVTAGGGAPTLMETAWLPMVQHDAAIAKGFATAWVAADERAFYFAARIADDTPDAGMLRFATRDPDADFYPAVALELDPERTTARRERTLPPGAPFPAAWEPLARRMELDLDLPGERVVSLALHDQDGLQRLVARYVASSREDGRKLAVTEAREAAKGVWTRLRLSGRVRVSIESPMWIKAGCCAVAVDPLPADAAAGAVQPSERTAGADWAARFGRDLLLLPGQPARGTVPAAWNDAEVRTEHRWPEGVRRFTYRRSPELPMGSAPHHDNVQLAFNVLDDDAKPWYPAAPGTFKGYAGWWDSDYEYALNPVRADLGGGTEVWRIRAPGLPDKHFYPRSPAAPGEGAVAGAQLVIRREAGARIVECALPWQELPAVQAARAAGRPVRFSFRVNDNAGGSCMELSRGRSVAKRNLSFKPDWVEHWANELEFAWER
ncbi:MAG: hypothetical protein L6R48_23085 [Planctomycetes bacterium]|nr:hypothetical protein [Planctomycetota bacterium]